jgi:radical SAM family uncharacterized protein/radical SAM-linked protein
MSESSAIPATLLEGVLHEVQRPSRYVGLELNAAKKAWQDARLRFCLAFPEVYEIGMSHLGLAVLYRILNACEGILADRAYCPWPDMEEVMRRRGIPLWGIESRMPLRRFDVLGFSLQSELLVTNMLTMLDLSGLPLRARDRRESDPLVIAGGPCAGNPEPFAPFVDAFCVGDGEVIVAQLASLLMELPQSGALRERALEELASLEGVYVPIFYEASRDDAGRLSLVAPLRAAAPARVKRRYEPELLPEWIPMPPLVAASTPVQERLNIEVSRGCTWGCRFCHAGYFQRPLRERDPGDLLESAVRGIELSGFDEVNLLSLSTADYSALTPLMDALLARLGPRKVALSLPSLRANSMRSDIPERILQVKKTGFTFAPEAGTQRLRNVINKAMTDEEIHAAVKSAFDAGWRLVKLYFMIGLPTETMEDIEGIVRLVRSLEKTASRSGKGGDINVSIGPFVPKPHTPFQWEPFEGVAPLTEKFFFLRRELEGRRVKVKWQNLESSFLEAAISRGDRSLAGVIERAWRDGARFDSWTERLDPGLWENAFRAQSVDPCLFTARWDPDSPLPWNHIDTGVSNKYLRRELAKALAGETTEDCRWGACQGCGIAGAPHDNRLAAPLSTEIHISPKSRPESEPCLRRTLRIRYSVTGMARFLSHLERGNVLRRALTRTGLTLVYTSGYSPRPKTALGPPLAVGIASTAELADFLIGDPRRLGSAGGKLSAGFPEGMQVEEAWLDFPECFAALSEIASAEYGFDFSPAPDKAWEKALRLYHEYVRQERVIWRKEVGGREKELDMKRALPRFAPHEDRRAFEITVNCNDPQGQNAGPRDVLEGVFRLSPGEFHLVKVVRTGYLYGDGRPFFPAPGGRLSLPLAECFT